jgi:dihydrofolate reductase
VNQPVKEFACQLRLQPGKDIWMMGGAEIIGSFLDAGEIDEFVMNVIPVFIGEGIPLMARRHRTVPLNLTGSKAFEGGVVMLHYGVGR